MVKIYNKKHKKNIWWFKSEKQCVEAANNSNKILGMMRRGITYKEKTVMLKLYKSLVRPILEYSMQVWRPYMQTYVDVIEKIQRRFTRMIHDIID